MKIPPVLPLVAGVAAIAAVIGLSSCEPAPTSGRGLVLPPGDIEAGKAAFTHHHCTRCHTVAGVDLPPYEGAWDPPMELGGSIIRVKTYGELVTSITNPDHILSQEYLDRLSDAKKADQAYSPMPDLNSELLVKDLLDLVTFLHSRYVLIRPDLDSDYMYFP